MTFMKMKRHVVSVFPCYVLYQTPETGYFGAGQASFASAELHFLNYVSFTDKVLFKTKLFEIGDFSTEKAVGGHIKRQSFYVGEMVA